MVDNAKPVLLGPDGQPIRRDALKQEIAGPSLTGIRSPLTGYPADGLEPYRLASILREADAGNPMRYLELAEQIEERDMHYLGVLGTRKRSVSQLNIEVHAASDDPLHIEQADRIRAWLDREELEGEVFNILDAIGKGVSFTEIVWDTSSGQWEPAKLAWRDPRWFRFDYHDGTTPMLRGNDGDQPLPAFKFIFAVIRAKSGLPIRSGLARLAAWSWMFKAFTLRDWAIFTQTYGQPVRVGKYPVGTSENDKDTLFRAVANIAGDCAAIIPAGMSIDFVETANVGAGGQLYKDRADWFDRQVSKAVLGQTATTDAIAGGHAVGQEHRQVQKDIERADAKELSAILNRDLIRPWIALEYGPQQKYPRLRIRGEEDEDIKQLVDSVVALVPYGLRVEKSWMNDKLGVPDPDDSAVLLTAPTSAPPSLPFALPSLNASRAPARVTTDEITALTDQAEKLCGPAVDDLIDEVRDIVERATSFAHLQSELKRLKPGLAEKNLAGLVRMARVIAHLTGRADLDA